jgi:hypothetical protein
VQLNQLGQLRIEADANTCFIATSRATDSVSEPARVLAEGTLQLQRRRLLTLGLSASVAVLVGGLTWRAFSSELKRAHSLTQGRSKTFVSRFGVMEYAESGAGPPVLMIHGTGGGFDQGLNFAAPLSSRWRIIAPSLHRASAICAPRFLRIHHRRAKQMRLSISWTSSRSSARRSSGDRPARFQPCNLQSVILIDAARL